MASSDPFWPVNWLPYALGGLFIAYVFFNVLNFFGHSATLCYIGRDLLGGKKKEDEDKDD